MINLVTLTPDEYLEYEDGYIGICLACGERSDGGCNPEAIKKNCEACGEPEVYGVYALLEQRIIVVSESVWSSPVTAYD